MEMRALLASSPREVLGKVIDRWGRPARRVDVAMAAEAAELAAAAANHPRSETIVLVEGEADYGNVRGALDLLMAAGAAELIVYVSVSEEGFEWAAKRGAHALYWNLGEDVYRRSSLFHRVLTATVSVHENHDFWRDPVQRILRSALAGSRRVQLWHGRPAPYEKAFGRELLDSSWNFAMFADLASTTTAWDCLITDRQEVQRRSKQIPAHEYVFDISPRMIGPLRRAREGSQRTGRILVAPSYPSGDMAAAVVERRATEIAESLKGLGLTPVLRIHPLTSPELQARLVALDVKQDPDRGIYGRLETYDGLVTDVSSLANDFNMLGKPVALDMTSIRAGMMERDFNRLTSADYAHLIDAPDHSAQVLRTAFIDSEPRAPMSDEEFAALGFPAELGSNVVAAILDQHHRSLQESAKRSAHLSPGGPR